MPSGLWYFTKTFEYSGYCPRCKEPCGLVPERWIKSGTAASEKWVYLSDCCEVEAVKSLHTNEVFHYGDPEFK